MKNIILFLMFSCVMLFCSCGVGNKNDFNEQQAAFDNFLANSRDDLYKQGNDIQKKEFMKNFEKDLYDFINTEKVFVNWQGKIKDIKTESVGDDTGLKFTIFYVPERYREVKFICKYFVETNNLDSDSIYLKVKQMSDYTTVYFDGFIRTDNAQNVDYYHASVGDEMNIAYPSYEFWIVNISSDSHGALSQNLKEALEYSRQYVSVLKQNYLGEITDKTKEDELSKITPQLDMAKSKLSESELQYWARYNTALIRQIMYND